MIKTIRLHRLVLSLLLFLASMPVQSIEYEAGESVTRHGVVDDDLYLAGAQVEMHAAVDGDVVIAGGQLNLEGDIGQDVIAAGGTIALRSVVNDDARLAGGELRITGQVGDDLVAAGGRIFLGPAASVGGSAWLSGGDIRIEGVIDQELRVTGGRVVVAGTINGNVELWAEQIVIEKSAVITGRLHYRSSHEAVIANGVRIDGEVVYTPVDVDMKPVMASALLAGLALLLSIIIAAVALYLLFPGFSMRISQTLQHEPWISLGLGLAVFAAVPLLATILFSTVIGALLALVLLLIYLVMLLAGYFAGALFVASRVLDKMGKADVSNSGRAVALSATLFVLALINLIPIAGTLVSWAVLLAGLGALSRQLYLSYSA
jgi:cytoskeletal protein CcmA (bactofilin family)